MWLTLARDISTTQSPFPQLPRNVPIIVHVSEGRNFLYIIYSTLYLHILQCTYNKLGLVYTLLWLFLQLAPFILDFLFCAFLLAITQSFCASLKWFPSKRKTKRNEKKNKQQQQQKSYAFQFQQQLLKLIYHFVKFRLSLLSAAFRERVKRFLQLPVEVDAFWVIELWPRAGCWPTKLG